MVKVCEIFGCTVTEGQGVRMHKFPKHNFRSTNAWISWISLNRPGWTLKSNSRVCELHFVSEDYIHIKQDTMKRLKQCAIPSLQVKEVENSENHCTTKIIRRFRQTLQYMRDVTNIHNIIDDKKNTTNMYSKDHTYSLNLLTCNKEVQDCMEIQNIREVEELTKTCSNHNNSHNNSSQLDALAVRCDVQYENQEKGFLKLPAQTEKLHFSTDNRDCSNPLYWLAEICEINSAKDSNRNKSQNNRFLFHSNTKDLSSSSNSKPTSSSITK